MGKSKKISGGLLKRGEYLSDPTEIHKLRMIELAKEKELVEYEDIDKKVRLSTIKATDKGVGGGLANILYVIDMQNDFIKPPPAGAFSVLGGNTVVEKLYTFIRKNKRFFDKMIFSRDYHEHDHCGFRNDEDPEKHKGIHPPHCVQKSMGAAFDERIKSLLRDLLNDRSYADKTEIVFKAMEMEAFGASIATHKEGKWYNTHSVENGGRHGHCCKDKCDSLGDECLNLTGGFKIGEARSKLENIHDSIETKDLEQKYDIKDVLDELKKKKFKKHNIYITGLAGCHCVSETATNIADYFESEIFRRTYPNFDYQIYIIEDLTRYAFVPLIVGPPVFTRDSILERLDSNEEKDDLSLYIFEHEFAGNFKLMSKEDVRAKAEVIATAASDPTSSQYFHYLVSLKETIDKYSTYNGKIKLIMNLEDQELSTRLREVSNSGGGRKTQKKQKRKKSKIRKGKTGKIRKNRKNKKLSKRHRY